MGKRDGDRQKPPATTPEGRENQMVALAIDAVEKRIRNGTASAQELVHLMRLGSINARLERDILKQQKELMSAKTDAIQSQKRVEELYANALAAMKRYSGDQSETGNDLYDY